MRLLLCYVTALTVALSGTLQSFAVESVASAPQSPPQLRVAAVQMRSTRDLSANVQKIKEHLARCAADGVRVAAFPECALTGYFDNAHMRGLSAEQLAHAEREVAEACRTHGIFAIIGTPTLEADQLYNSAIVISPSGKILIRYHKVQLAESWPAAGDQLYVFLIDGVPASIIICHDERYPELVRLPVLAGARVVFCLSHESGLDKESKLVPYRAQVQARAVENTVYLVQANAPANADATGSHGQSRLIAPDGNVIQEASMFGEDVLTATLDMKQATGRQAQQSIDRGPFGDWWRAGVAQVRMIREDERSDRPSPGPGEGPGEGH
jgi:predicted amidohydrolase